MARAPAKKAAKTIDSRGKTTTRSRRAATQEQGPQYQVLRQSFINNQLVDAGATVVFYGLPGSALKPLNAEAKARKEAVRAIRTDRKLDATGKLDALRELSNEWNGVEEEDAWEEGDAALGDEPLSDEERRELEKHAAASVQATREKEQDNTNAVRVQLQGDPANPKGNDASNQGATPVTDGKKA